MHHQREYVFKGQEFLIVNRPTLSNGIYLHCLAGSDYHVGVSLHNLVPINLLLIDWGDILSFLADAWQYWALRKTLKNIISARAFIRAVELT